MARPDDIAESILVKNEEKPQIVHSGGKIELQEQDCYEKLGFCWPTWKKWAVLSTIFAVQCSMNFNASVYSNSVPLLSEHFQISEQYGRVGQMVFLIAYAFGSELWAPWSEEYGRWPVLQLSLFFVNIWQIPCALAPNFATIIVCRMLGGLSSAGGSVTLGMVADMWEAEDQQYAISYVVLSSCGGSVIGPVVGGFLQEYCSWHWNFWLQLIFGVVVQAIHFFTPESRASILVDREAKRRRKNGEEVYGPNEIRKNRITVKEVLTIWYRPFYMFATEPIVLFLSLLSGFSDALIFTFLESFGPVFKQWNFSTVQLGLSFICLWVGYIIAYFSFFPFIHRERTRRAKDPNSVSPEYRLFWLLFTAPLETIGLFGFAWTSMGPAHNPWIVPLIFATLIAIANYAIYMATIDYMVASYGVYAASATGGNALARDFLAGVAAMYATPFYENIPGKYSLEWPSTILAFLALLFTIPIYVFYFNGPKIRARSKFAQELAKEKEEVRAGHNSRQNSRRMVSVGHTAPVHSHHV